MSIAMQELGDDAVEVTLSGKLHASDYDEFVPRIEAMIERVDKIRVLMIMEDFHGWDLGAVWQDTKFDMRHHADFAKLAMVGDKKWEELMAKVCRPFTGASIKYFDKSEEAAARDWITAD